MISIVGSIPQECLLSGSPETVEFHRHKTTKCKCIRRADTNKEITPSIDQSIVVGIVPTCFQLFVVTLSVRHYIVKGDVVITFSSYLVSGRDHLRPLRVHSIMNILGIVCLIQDTHLKVTAKDLLLCILLKITAC